MTFWTKLFGTKDSTRNNLADTKQTDKISTSKKSDLLLPLLESLKNIGKRENVLHRNGYDTSMPCIDFSFWIIEKFRQKDYRSIWAFYNEYFENDESLNDKIKFDLSENILSKNYTDDSYYSLHVESFINFIRKDFNKYIVAGEKMIFEIQYYFFINNAIFDLSKGFTIGNNGESAMLSKILCVYPFTIETLSFEILIEKANQYLKEMKKEEKQYKGDYWKTIPYFNITDINLSYTINTKTDILNKLQSLGIGERLHFFDFASSHSFAKYWSGNSRYKTKQIGVCETESVKKMTELNLFTYTDDIECIPYIATKDEFKSKAEQGGFELKKSWNVQKIYEYLIKTEQGKIFLKEFIQDKKPVKFNEIYNDDLHLIIDYQEQVKIISQLISII